MKDKQLTLNTRKMLGFRLADVFKGNKKTLGVTTGAKLSVKVGRKNPAAYKYSKVNSFKI